MDIMHMSFNRQALVILATKTVFTAVQASGTCMPGVYCLPQMCALA